MNHAAPKPKNLKTWSTVTGHVAWNHAFHESPTSKHGYTTGNRKMIHWGAQTHLCSSKISTVGLDHMGSNHMF